MRKFYLPLSKKEIETTQMPLFGPSFIANKLWYYSYTLGIKAIKISAIVGLLFLMGGVVNAQSCVENDIGFNTTVNTNTLSICDGETGTTIDGGVPASGAFEWQVSTTTSTGPYATVSPDPGNVAVWTIPAAYYNTPGTYYFIRVTTGTGGSCDENSDVVTLTVNALPAVNAAASVCVGANITLSPATGGTWTSSNNSIATVTNAGVVTGVNGGTVTFTFTLTSTGCSNTTASVTVNDVPVVLAGPSVCIGATIDLEPSGGGTWSSSNNSFATVTNDGLVTGVSAGSVTFTFTETSTGCENTTTPVIVNSLPTVSAGPSVCVGATLNITPATGGTWSGSNIAVATVTDAGVVTGVSAGSATFTFTQTSTGCERTTGSVSVNSLPAVTADPSVCVGATMNLTPASGGTWTSSNNSLATVTNAGVVTGVSNGTVTFTFTQTSTGCENTTSNVTVNSIPAVTADPSVCVGATMNLTPATGGTWVSSNNAVATVTNAGVVTGVSAGSVTFTFTQTSTGCDNTTGSVVVNSLPTVAAGASVCIGSTITLTPASGGTWTSSNNAVATVTNAGVVTGVSTGSATFTFTQTSTGCENTTTSVTINNVPTVNADPAVCVGSTMNLSPSTGGTWVSSNPAIATVTNAGVVTGVSGGSVTFTFTQTSTGCDNTTAPVTVNNLPAVTAGATVCVGATMNLTPATGGTWISSNTAFATVTNAGVATGVSGGNVTFTFTQTSTGCERTTSSVLINNLPVVTEDPSVCVGFTMNVTPASGGTWVSSNNAFATVTNGGVVTGVSSGTVTFTFTQTSTGCTNTTASVTVNPTPTVNTVPDQSLCKGEPSTLITFTGAVAGTTYNWVNDNTFIGLGPNGSGNIASFNAVNIGTTVLTANVTVTPTISGCVGTPKTFTITVDPTPVINNPGSQNLCNGDASAVITFSGPVAGTVYNWTNNQTSIGLAASGTGNIGSFTVTNPGTTNIVATITVTPEASECEGVPITFTITVKPTPTVDDPADQVVCRAANTTAVTFTGAVPGTIYNWTNSNTSIGLAPSGSGNIPVFTATNTGTTPLVATITVTPTLNSCPGTPQTFTITVNPSTSVSTPASQSLCNATNTTLVTFSGGVTGTTYDWTNSNATIGLPATGTGNIAAFSAVNTGTAPVTATIQVIPTANGCPGPSASFTITVKATPTVNTITDQTLCKGASTTAVAFTGAITPGTIYNWTNNTPTIGLAASGTGNIASFIAANPGTTPLTATITVTPTTNGCDGTPKTFSITVNPTAAVTNPGNQSVCKGSSTTAITFTGPVTWTNSNTTIGLAASGTGDIASFAAINATATAVVANILVTPTANGCNGTAFGFTFTVNPVATITSPRTGSACSNTLFTVSPVDVTDGVVPTGTTYTWTAPTVTGGVTGGAAGSGASITGTLTNPTTAAQTATYTVTPTTGSCPGPSFQLVVTINALPPFQTIDFFQTNVYTQQLCIGALVGGGGQNDIDVHLDPPFGAGGQPPNNYYDNNNFDWNWEYATGNAAGPLTGFVTSPGTTTTHYQHVLPPSPSPFSPIGDYWFRFSLTQNGCTTYSNNVHLQVTSTLVTDAGGPYVRCLGSSSFALAGSSVNGTTTGTLSGTWSIFSGGGTLSNTSPITTGNAAISAVTYTPAAGFTGTAKLVLKSNAPGGGCQAAADTAYVIMLPLGNLQGCNAPANWTLANSAGGNGSIDVSQVPCAASLNGSNTNSGSAGTTDYRICSGAGNLSFNWVFTAPTTGGATPVWRTADQTFNSGPGTTRGSFRALRPTNLAVGDLIIVILHARDNVGSVAVADGFSAIRQEASGNSGNDNRGTVLSYWKVATATEPAFYDFQGNSMGAGDTWAATAGRVTGADRISPIDIYNGNNSGSGGVTNIPVSGFTTLGANRLLVAAISIVDDDHGAITKPGSMTTIASGALATSDQLTYGSYFESFPTAGATGTRPFSWTASDAAAGQMFAIKPAGIPDDSAFVIVNGVQTLISGVDGTQGTFSIPVNSNDIIGFRVKTTTNTGGAGKLTFYNVNVPNDKPVVTGTAAITLASCNPATPTNGFIAPTATDNCTTPTILTGYPQTGPVIPAAGLTCINTQTRTWIFVDNCGLQSDPFVQTITWSTDADTSVLATPGVQNLCLAAGNNYTIPAIGITESCSGTITTNWAITGTTTRSGTGTDASGLFNPGTSTIKWTVVNACGYTSIGYTTVNAGAGPTAVISGTGFVCSGSPATVSVALSGSQPWSITYTDGSTSTTVNNITTSPYTFNPSPTTNTTYTLTAMSDTRCTGNYSGSAVLTVRAKPTAVISVSGSSTICSGGSATLSIAPTGVGPWSVTYTDGVTPVTIPSITFSPYTFSVSPITGTTYTITALSDANCTGTFSGSAVVGVNPRPNVTVTPASATICVGGSTSLTAGGASTYTWSPATGLSSSSAITVVANPSTTTTYTVVGTDGNNCTNTTTVTVTVNTPPTTTGVSICPGGTGSLTSSTCVGGTFPVGPRNPAISTNLTGVGGSNAWQNPGNITTAGAPYANIPSLASGSTNYLRATGYGFSIPAAATITNISVAINRQITVSSTLVRDTVLRLLQAGTQVGNNLAATATPWPVAFTVANYGGAVATWGAAWTPADVNNPNFGVVLSVRNTSAAARELNVDYIQVTITYTLSGSQDWYTVSSGGTLIGSGSPFNPVGVAGSGLANTNTASTTIYYSECAAAPGCRTATNFVILPGAVGGTLPPILACNASSGLMTLTGYSGNIVRWEVSTDNGSTWTNIANTTDEQSYTNVTQGAMYRVLLTTPGCTSTYSTVSTLGIHNLWTGQTSIDWNTASNWSGNVLPSTSCPDVIIPGGTPFQPTLGTGTATINNLVIKTGGYLTVNTANLQIAGTISNAGNFDATNGTLEFNGTSTQNIGGTMFLTNTLGNLIVSNTSNLVVSNTAANVLNIKGSLSFGNVNNSNLTTGDNVILLSTATGTARVADITNNNVNNNNKFTGNVTVQRYYPATRAWRLITAPLSGTGTIFATWQNNGVYQVGKGALVTGPVVTPANGLDPSIQMNPSLKWGSALTDVANTKTMNLSNNTGNADNIGYFMFVRGDRNPVNTIIPNTNITTLTATGKLQTGTQTFPANNVSGEFTLIGNPYASPVDFNKLTRNNLLKRFYVWDPRINVVGGYIVLEDLGNTGTYTITPPSPGGQNNIIQSSQALFVQTASNGTASLIFNEPNKSGTNNLGMFRPLSFSSGLRVNLYKSNEENTTQLADGIFTEFNVNYSNDVTLDDAPKFYNVNETIGLFRNGKLLSVERRPSVSVDDTLFLRLTKTTQRKYRFEIIADKIGQENLAGFVDDKFLKRKTPLNMNSSTMLDFAVTSDAASAASDRFSIVFKPSVVFTNLQAEVVNKDVAVSWNVASEFNIREYEIERSSDAINFTKLSTKPSSGNSAGPVSYDWLDNSPVPGIYYYRVRSTSHNDVTAYSNVVTVKINRGTPAMYVVPNPVTDNIIHLQMNNMVKGFYHIKLLNNLGQVAIRNTINHSPGTATETIRPKFKLISGIYQLEVISPNNKVTTLKVIVK